MNRLQSELLRLYLVPPQPQGGGAAQPPALVGASGEVRALVMALTRPPDWALLSKVWQGVQAELGLPAPAIAVSGVDALQLWFSLETPVEAARAQAFLQHLRERFLPEVEPGRLRLLPTLPAPGQPPEAHAAPVHAALLPAAQQDGNWSAFLAPDLAPVFADTPWLDLPPNEEGQAALLRGLATMDAADFDAAFERLAAHVQPAQAEPSHTAAAASGAEATLSTERASAASEAEDPVRFLRRVMNDERVALALRIEAAKALLQHSDRLG